MNPAVIEIDKDDKVEIYQNGLAVLKSKNSETWYYQGERLYGINNREEALRALELKAFW